jgi:hypothetical protein
VDTQEIDSTLDELENRLDRLRALYEQYFLGIEKIEPAVARKDVDRRFWLLRRIQIRNTARRWRLQVLIQRYNTFQQYWTRICREIENGTYVRHLLKAKKNLGAEPKTWAAKKRMGLLRRDRWTATNGAPDAPNGAPEPAALPHDAELTAAPLPTVAKAPPKAPEPRAGAVMLTLDDLGPLDLDFDDEPTPLPRPAVKRASAAPVPPPAAPAPRIEVGKPPPAIAPAATSPAAAPAGSASTLLSEDRVRKLHAELVAAKRQLNQGDNVSMDSLGRSLRETEKKLRAQHGGRSVDFQIVVKDGKPVVKPVLRK